MATIVNNPGTNESSSTGWIVAGVVIVVVALIALFVWPGYAKNMSAPTADTTNIEVNVPNPMDTGVSGEMGGEEMPQ
ncbi:hypothetical protein KKH15_00045 [Patescibacteria group bacterium]|nr:hypothetical protein [Patescibacteria group bacterium]MBU1754770.1 hypothetical protein [Patescibacteria group bacterium]